MSKIAAISTTDVHRITSGQVIVDLATAVKELVENSIDAGADKIDVVFKNYGLDSLECIDNGSGIDEESYNSLALKHYTSKISSFQDVSQVHTLGFRGEALSSLCAISTLVVTTTTTPPKAHKLEYDFHGKLVKKSIISRNKGTTISVSQLFNNLPVRKKELTKNCKRQFSKCVSLLQCYTIIQENIKISVWHITNNGRKNLVLSSTKDQGISKNIISVFGSGGMQGLSPIDIVLDLNDCKPKISRKYAEDPRWDSLDYKIRITGYISKNSFGCGRTSKDRQFIYINRRPIDYPQLLKCCNEVYRSFNNVQYPVCILDFQIAPELIDVNVTPDKRMVLLQNEEYVIDELREKLFGYFESQELVLPLSSKVKSEREFDFSEEANKKRKVETTSQELISEFKNDDIKGMDFVKEETEDLKQVEQTHIKEPEQNTSSFHAAGAPQDNFEIGVQLLSPDSSKGRPTQLKLDSFINPSQDFSAPNSRASSFNRTTPEDEEEESEKGFKEDEGLEDVIVEIGDEKFEERASQTCNNHLVFKKRESTSSSCCSHSEHSCLDEADDEEMDDEEVYGGEGSDDKRGLLSARPEVSELNVRSPLPNTTASGSRTLSEKRLDKLRLESLVTEAPIDLNTVMKGFDQINEYISDVTRIKRERSIFKNGNIEDTENEERQLTLTVSKTDFKKMEIVGQFNLGFIIVTRKKNSKYDMFIVDQHASDEKYNFEMLQKTTVFKSQRLLSPQIIEMSVIDELIVMDNLPIFEKNGFKLNIDESQPQGCRVKLISLPVSKKTLFDINDFHELVHLVKENDGMNKSSVRCSKIRAMFAMRACRSSIMIGKPLTKKTMVGVVRHLSELDKPWNCPHGRPTMRHLMELRDWDSFNEDYRI